MGTTLPGQLLLLIWSLSHRIWPRRLGQAEKRDASLNDVAFTRFGWAFLFAAVISAVFSDHPTMAFAISIGFVLLFWVVALGTRYLVESPLIDNPQRLVEWILAAGVVGSLYGIYTVIGLGHPRAVGIGFGTNSFGGLTALLGILAIGYIVQERQRRWWLAALPVYLVALALSMSRGSWIGFAVSAVIFAGFLAFRKIRDRRYFKWTLIIFLLVSLVFSLLLATSPSLRERFASTFSLEHNADRVLIWRAAIEMTKDRPLTGVGGGVFPLVYEEYRVEGEDRSTVSFAHSLPLNVLAEFGILGFIPFAGMIGLSVVRGWRLARHSGPLVIAVYAGFIGMLVHDLFDNVTFGMNFGGLFWFLMGFHVHLYRRQHLGKERQLS